MRRRILWSILPVIASALSLINGACARREAEPTPPEQVRPAAVVRPPSQFNPVKGAEQGAREASLLSQPLPQLHSHLEIRTIQIPAGEPVSFPVDYEGVLEVRAGTLATVVDGKSQPHERGAMWQVAKGSRITLQASGEVAVLRAVYLVPGEK